MGSNRARLRGPAVAVVFVLASLAGCNAVLGDGAGETTTITPVPVDGGSDREGSQGTAPQPDVTLPPGLSRRGMVDAERLVAAHERAVSEGTFVRRVRRVSVRNGSKRVVSRLNRTAWVVDGRVVREDVRLAFENVSQIPTRLAHRSEFVTGNRTVRFVRFQNGSTARSFRPDGVAPQVSTPVVTRYLDVENASVSPVTVDGTELVRIVGTNPDESLRQSLSVGLSLLRYRVVALVEPDGFVRRFQVRIVGSADGTYVRRVIRVRYHLRESLDVPNPDWLNRTPTPAVANTTTAG